MFDTDQIIAHGLTNEEFDLAVEIINRVPNMLELGIFSVMWSEHCSYKSSRHHLGKFPTDGPQVIQGPGENAGIVDIGDGDAVVFKMESHNHPSYIEPHQGAATGVGGILRDIFTMGARPVASLNSIRFGVPEHPKTKYLVNGVVEGIAAYGNCIGVPTIGGELVFNPSYNGNCLVNAFNLGLVKTDKIFLGKAEGEGNPIIYAGSKTGRDGIHGATMASAEFDDGIEERRPTVQVGDPFTEKKLLEACLELFQTDYVVGIQDMGAAGMTSSSFEMAGRSGTGVDIDLANVPHRETGMTPYEIMLSESQERMLIVCHNGTEDKVKEIFHKWEIHAEVIGKVTSDGMARIRDKGEVVAELPALPLSEKAPKFSRLALEPENLEERRRLDLENIPEPADYTKTLKELLASPNLCSKEWVYRQYDHQVMTNTIQKPGSDASVIRVKGTEKAVAMSLDCNSRYCYLDPYTGGMQAVAEAARNVACSGAKPLAITDCLNFGSPERSDVMWEFVKAIEGMTEACKVLGTPVVSGNVSFYNQTDDVPVWPTPTVGAVGLLSDHTKMVDQYFKEEGDAIILIGETWPEIGGSEYLSVVHGLDKGTPPKLDLQKEFALQTLMQELADERLVSSMHDISDGGLAVCLAESLFTINGGDTLGFEIAVNSGLRPDLALFSESQSRVVVTCPMSKFEQVLQTVTMYHLPVEGLGKVTAGKVTVTYNGKDIVDTTGAELRKGWEEALPKMMAG